MFQSNTLTGNGPCETEIVLCWESHVSVTLASVILSLGVLDTPVPQRVPLLTECLPHSKKSQNSRKLSPSHETTEWRSNGRHCNNINCGCDDKSFILMIHMDTHLLKIQKTTGIPSIAIKRRQFNSTYPNTNIKVKENK
jgi:hypothetical protein